MKFSLPSFASLFVGVFSFFGSLAHGQTAAHFTDGTGTASVDQYEGIAGNGWTNAWSRRTNGTNAFVSFTGTVTDVNPLNGGGNYLSTTLVAGATASKGAESRGYGDFGSLSLSAPYSVKFSLRLDSDLSVLNQPTDYLQAYDLPNGDSDFGASGTWLVRAFGATPAGTSLPGQTWLFYNGGRNGAAYSAANFISSGVSLVSGTVYDFVIEMDPATLSYRVNINGGGFTDWLGYRRGTAPTASAVNFGAQLAGGDRTLTYSVDNIDIAPVPEPSAIVLCALGGLAAAVFRRRFR